MFEIKGDKPQWKIVTDVLKTKDIGDIVTYEEILSALGPDFPRNSLSPVVWSAIRKFRETDKRTFENVRTVGWRMVEATEHSRLARRAQLRGKRRLADAVSISSNTDLTRLNPEQRRFQQAQELHLRQLLARLTRVEEKVEKTEEKVEKTDLRVGAVEKDQVGFADELERVKSLLRRFGITEDKDSNGFVLGSER